VVEKNNVIVANIDEKIVGYCIFVFKEHKETAISFGRKALFIDAIGVLEDCKRKGIGKNLFSFVENIARENECDTIELNVNVKNKDAIEFYNSIGMIEKNIVMDYRLK
jgi:ribosomal protein S18 acetylase RimI-like enzyme